MLTPPRRPGASDALRQPTHRSVRYWVACSVLIILLTALGLAVLDSPATATLFLGYIGALIVVLFVIILITA